MVRVLILVALSLVLGVGAYGDDKNKAGGDNKGKPAATDNSKSGDTKNTGKGHEATITKVDQKNHSVTVKMKDKDGKEAEKTFKLTEEARYVDSTGKVAAMDIFQSGDYVLVVEEAGHLKELHKQDKHDKGTGTSNSKPGKPGGGK